jgi:hypothetical protein
MNNTTLVLKIKQRLNKLASNDYDNIECWQVVEAFNKAQVEWVRRQLRGSNMFKDGDEQSKRRIDDLQILLKEETIETLKKDLFFETRYILPEDYLEYKRITIKAKSDCCPEPRLMVTYLAEESNRDILLRDELKKPSFDWGETFFTFINNKIRVYTNNEFKIEKAVLTYYRQPIYIQIEGCVDPYSTLTSTANVICEFKDDIVELIIDETVSILAGDIESGNQFGRGSQSAERAN